MWGLSERAWRAVVLVGAAIVAVGFLAIAHLGGHAGRAGPAPRATPAGPWQLLFAAFGDADHGVVAMNVPGGAGDSYVTADGGRSWRPRRVGTSLTTFLDREHAVAVATVPTPWLDISRDAGRTWMTVKTPVRGHPFGFTLNHFSGGPSFLDPDNGWWLDTPPAPLAGPIALWRTGDGGFTWRPLDAAGLTTGAELSQPVFVDQLRGAILEGPLSDAWPSLMTSSDGGETWNSTALPQLPVGPAHLAMTGAQAAQLQARNGRLLLFLTVLTPGGAGDGHWASSSADGGLTWAPWSRAPATPRFPFGTPVLDVAGHLLLTDDQLLWVSADDGRTWRGRSLGVPTGIHALSVIAAPPDALVVAAQRARPSAASDLTLIRSVGSGPWTEIPLPSPAASG
jgi:hypothetical protein